MLLRHRPKDGKLLGVGPLGPSVARRFRLTTENVFLISGILIVLLYWVADLYAAWSSALEDAHGAGGTLVTRMNVIFFAIGFSLLGLLYEQHPRLMKDARWSLRVAVGYLLLLDGLVHLFAFNDHLAEPFPAAFFGVLAPVQILAGVLFPNAGPRGNLWWLVLAAFLVTAYFATRAFAVWPFGKIEELDAMGLLSKGVEVLTIISLVVLLRLERGSGTQAAAGTLAGAKS